MRKLIPILLLPVALAACGGPREAPAPVRDLSMAAPADTATPAVLSDIERGRVVPHKAPTRRPVQRAQTGDTAHVQAATNAVVETLAEPEPISEPVVAAVATAPAAPVPQPSRGIGTPLSAGDTVMAVPAVAMGGGVRGGHGEVDIIRRGGGPGVIIMDGDDCAPSRGSVIAINRPYARIRRF